MMPKQSKYDDNELDLDDDGDNFVLDPTQLTIQDVNVRNEFCLRFLMIFNKLNNHCCVLI